MSTPESHNREITNQFTRQAAPFAKLHQQDDSVQLMIQAAETKNTDTLLDVACGPGLVACAFARTAAHATGIDLTPAMIDQAKSHQARENLTNLSWHIGNVATLPFPDNSFDIVVSRYAFHHLLTPAQTLTEMARVCRPGGRIVLCDVFTTTPEQSRAYDTLEKLRDPSHTHALQLEEFKTIFTRANLPTPRTDFLTFDVNVDTLLTATRTPPGPAAQFRNTLLADLPHNHLGLNLRQQNGTLLFSFPIALLTATKVPSA